MFILDTSKQSNVLLCITSGDFCPSQMQLSWNQHWSYSLCPVYYVSFRVRMRSADRHRMTKVAWQLAVEVMRPYRHLASRGCLRADQCNAVCSRYCSMYLCWAVCIPEFDFGVTKHCMCKRRRDDLATLVDDPCLRVGFVQCEGG